MQFVLRGLTLRLVGGELDAPTYGQMLTRLVDLPEIAPATEIRLRAVLLQLTMPAQSVRVLKPDTEPDGGDSSYKRVR